MRRPETSPSRGVECLAWDRPGEKSAQEVSWTEGLGGAERRGASRVDPGCILAIVPRVLTPKGVVLVLCVIVGNGVGVRLVARPRLGDDGETEVEMDISWQQGKEEAMTVRSGKTSAGECRRKLSLSCGAEGKKVGGTPSFNPCTTCIAGCPTVLLLLLLL